MKNKSGNTIYCSHFQPVKEERVSAKLPCVVYMHGNCSSRIEALSPASVLLPYNITVFCFDFSGCGLSEGEYVTLGYKEKDDLQSALEYLRSTHSVSIIGLWGRSMGAATAIFQCARDPSIAGMILDSPFAHLSKLSLELARTHTKIPGFVASFV